jgi:hypothetical protein
MPSPPVLIAAGAAVGTLCLTYGQDKGKLALSLVFAALFTAQLLAWGVWRLFIYPHYVSPLRHLPQPSGGHWLFGQGLKIIKEPTGAPANEW